VCSNGDGTEPEKTARSSENAIRLKHYAHCTEKIYVQWIQRYIFSTTRQIFGTVGLPVKVIAKAEYPINNFRG
jgi:hypothetical protein